LQRQTEVVIEIALRLQDAVFYRQHMRNDLFGGRLACRTGYPDQRLAPQLPHSGGKLL
jgi:hypothetical protein